MKRVWSEASLNRLQGIHPDLRRVLNRALQESPVDFRVIEGLRTVERQRELVAKGASRTMNSRHITGHAVDLWPIDPATGKAAVSRDAVLWPLFHRIAPAVKAAARAEGVPIEWGGDWRTFKDGPHFQLPHQQYPAKGKPMSLVSQPSALPTRKVAAGGIGGVLTAAIIGLVDIYLPGVGTLLSPAITAAVTAAVAFLSAYMTKERAA